MCKKKQLYLFYWDYMISYNTNENDNEKYVDHIYET